MQIKLKIKIKLNQFHAFSRTQQGMLSGGIQRHKLIRNQNEKMNFGVANEPRRLVIPLNTQFRENSEDWNRNFNTRFPLPTLLIER